MAPPFKGNFTAHRTFEGNFEITEEVLTELAAKAPLDSIFDCDKLEKVTDDDGKPGWRCGWCKRIFMGNPNATRAVLHVVPDLDHNVIGCEARSKIHPKFMERYQAKKDYDIGKKKAKKRSRQAAEEANENHLESLVAASEARRPSKRRRHASCPSSLAVNVRSRSNSATSTLDSDDEVEGVSPLSLVVRSSKSSKTPSSRRSSGKIQPGIQAFTSPVDAQNDQKLSLAIADLIHSLGLPFSLTDDAKFLLCLRLARACSSKYKPPTRQEVAGALLDLNYDNYITKQDEKLLIQSDIFGLTFYGDGATVKGMPLINILASGAYNTTAVLEICDCSEQMENGGTKNATYIADLFLPHCQRLDPKGSKTDLFYFDGASNVQNVRSTRISSPSIRIRVNSPLFILSFAAS